MRDAAEAYCRVIEAAEGADRLEFASDAVRTLATVVAAACRLPDVEASDLDDDDPAYAITHDEWSDRFGEIQGVLGEWGLYWTAPVAYRIDEGTNEPELRKEFFTTAVDLRHLADDLADVWRDLRNGLIALDRGVPENDVIWEWRFGFRSHWGAHAAEALRALHQQMASSVAP